MTESIYTSRSRVDELGPLHRRAQIAVGAQADFGVHGPIRELFKLSPERELPLPVDYVVTAAGG